MINQYTMNEIETGFKLKSNFANFFGGNPYSDFDDKLLNLKSELQLLNTEEYEQISFDISEYTTNMEKYKYDYKKKDSNHPKKIVDQLSLVEKYITKKKLFEILDKISNLDPELKTKIGEALKVIIPIYEKSLKIQTLADKFFKLDPIIPRPKEDTKSERRKANARKEKVKKAMRKMDSFWRKINISLELDIKTVGKTLEEIQQKV